MSQLGGLVAVPCLQMMCAHTLLLQYMEGQLSASQVCAHLHGSLPQPTLLPGAAPPPPRCRQPDAFAPPQPYRILQAGWTKRAARRWTSWWGQRQLLHRRAMGLFPLLPAPDYLVDTRGVPLLPVDVPRAAWPLSILDS